MPSRQYYLSPELANPVAGIDVGTNSIRLIIAEGLRGGKYRILDDEKEATRLGARLGSTGKLEPEAVEKSLVALRRMKEIASGFQASQTRAIATCAVREAKDGAEFCERVQREVGLTLEVVSSKEEARFAFRSVQEHFDLEQRDVVLADIGGGSTELVMASNGVIEKIYATKLGAVRLTERLGVERMTSGDLKKLSQLIDKQLRNRVGKPAFVPQTLIGTGGTFTTIGAMVMASKGESDLPLRGYQVRRAEVSHLVDRLGKMNLKARRGVSGLSAERADIIVAGLAVVDRLMRYFHVNRLQVHTGGVRDGLLLSMVESSSAEAAPDNRPGPDPVETAARFAESCGADMPNTRHIASLARSLYEQLAPLFDLPAKDADLLEAAALMQDVGYLINYEDHHKHSYHLIINSGLSGFAPRDLQVIANVARYHRGAAPKRKHAQYQQLSQEDRLRVSRMASVLRVAGGLNRGRGRQVQELALESVDSALDLVVSADREPELDVWAAQRRAGFFEDVFGTPLRIRWTKNRVS
ncbi:MAG: Ppx/GppA family phosphatase [Planctomycetales bacterium]